MPVLPRRPLLCVLVVISLGLHVTATQQNLRERAREPYTRGLEQMRIEDFDGAAASFEAAVGIDPAFDIAYYMLGRAHLNRKQYAAAVYALTKCRDLHQEEARATFATRQEGDRVRRVRIQELERLISGLQATVPQTARTQEQIRQLEERRRQIQDADRAKGFDASRIVPAFVSLSLGSAHFRNGNLAEAEKAYLAAVGADPKTAEAHNNLAVVYMETGRIDQAENAVRAAERAGLTVAPALKEEIRKRKLGK